MHQRFFSRREALAAALLTPLAPLTVPARAQTGDWPSKPIRFVVAGPAGGGMDLYARMLTAPLQTALKANFVVDNKAGANSLIGNDAVAKAAPDGYTFLMTPSSAIAINPLVIAKMPYDTQKDLVPVAQIGAAGILLVATPSSGFKNLQDLVRYAKANPGKLAYGSWGNGSTGHLAMEGIKAHYGLEMTHVPYKGASAAVNDMLGDQLKVSFTDIASPIPHIKAGKLIAIGATGSGRGPALPDVPTLTEQGYKFDADGWFGIFAPGRTPMPIVQRMNAEINKILATDEMKAQFRTQNMLTPPIKTAEQFAATVKADMEMWQAIAKKTNLKAE